LESFIQHFLVSPMDSIEFSKGLMEYAPMLCVGLPRILQNVLKVSIT
jgi:hypothetical protein